MSHLESILTHSLLPKEFHAVVTARLAPKADSVRAQARLISEKFPQLKAETLHKAETAMQGLCILPGTGGKPHFIGNLPNWIERQFNDNEYVWGINRMFHWIPLLQAFALTGESRYAQKVIDELLNWIKVCPRPPLDSVSHFGRVDPWRSLEVGIRTFTSWPMILPYLAGTELLTPELLAEYAISLYEHGEVLYYAPPIFFPKADHNHYLMENLGLLEIATLLPELATAELWKTHAMRELERCAAAQMMPEGGQIEGCPHYHNGCIDWFVHALSLARANGLAFSSEFSAKMEKGIDYSAYALRPSGTAVPWGDSDADVLIAIRSLVNGFRLFNNLDYLRIAVNCCGAEAVRNFCIATAWDNIDIDGLLASLDQAEKSPRSISLPPDSWQKSLKQAMLRTDWSHDALSVFFACRTPVDNGHAHIDPMGFDFTAHGRALVVDPGRFTYREDGDRRDFKSAAYHNTLTINGRDPFEYIDSWAYGPQKPGTITDVRITPGCKAAFARHENYAPTIHHRAIALIEDKALLVIDRLENLNPGDRIQIYFHLDSIEVGWDPETARIRTADPHQANVLIIPGADLTGENLPGRVSDFIDVQRPSRRVCLTAAPSEEASRIFANVIVPWAASSPRPEVTAPKIRVTPTGIVCTFEIDGHPHSFDWPKGF